MAADNEETPTSERPEGLQEGDVHDPADREVGAGDAAAEEELAPSQLGTRKYVHAAFFVAGILVAYISSKVLLMVWNNLAVWEAAVDALPLLVVYGDDKRETFCMIGGGLIGLLTVVQTYRKRGIQRWADDVAGELAKVAWPDKEAVQSGTVVVLVASAVATVFIALLDRFWGFLTNLIYGAGA